MEHFPLASRLIAGLMLHTEVPGGRLFSSYKLGVKLSMPQDDAPFLDPIHDDE